ncbi:MAG: AAA family ATPase [Bacteroidota bacterium]
MMLKKLPIGIETFEKIRSANYLYIDKTIHIYNIISRSKYLFYARPRRFGKSLTLSTIKAIFEGKKALFKELWIAQHWDFTQIHPVVHFSFNDIDYHHQPLEAAIQQVIAEIAASYQIQLTANTFIAQFSELIKKLSKVAPVVLLVDEYDKPIIDFLNAAEIEKAKQHQRVLKQFYGVLKPNDPYLQLVFLTGVSKFSKVSIFSDLNNLQDLSMHPIAVALTGYTQEELEENFVDYIAASATALQISPAVLLEKIRQWYNGYSWDGKTRLYNPFSVLNFFSTSRFNNFWFDTGTPTFLVQLIKEKNYVELSKVKISELALSNFDIERLEVLPLLFQTGYLTIKSVDEFGLYEMDYPNDEVRHSMLQYLISAFRQDQDLAQSKPMVIQLHLAFQNNDIESIIQILKNIFKTIPSQIFIKDAERYYHSLIYLVFVYLGQYAESEVNTNDGRLDCVVKSTRYIYILEFKLDKSASKALAQIKEKGYAVKYSTDARPKVLLGINFSSQTKTVSDYLAEII